MVIFENLKKNKLRKIKNELIKMNKYYVKMIYICYLIIDSFDCNLNLLFIKYNSSINIFCKYKINFFIFNF